MSEAFALALNIDTQTSARGRKGLSFFYAVLAGSALGRRGLEMHNPDTQSGIGISCRKLLVNFSVRKEVN